MAIQQSELPRLHLDRRGWKRSVTPPEGGVIEMYFEATVQPASVERVRIPGATGNVEGFLRSSVFELFFEVTGG